MTHYRWCICGRTSEVTTPWEENSTESSSKIQAARALNKIPGVNLAVVQRLDLNGAVVEQLHKTRYRQWKRVAVGTPMEVEAKKRSAIRILNRMRPTVNQTKPVKITRELIRQVAIEAWKKYPQVLTDPYYQLGEMTLALVEQEIRQRLDDLRRGVVVKQAALRDYFN
jgi:hypothetical protein